MSTTETALPPVPARSLRHADMADLISLLQAQDRQKLDVVVPANSIRLNGGALEVAGIDAQLTETGVTDLSGLYRPTSKVDADLASLFEALHWDDDYTRNELANLRWGTSSDNRFDAVRNGRHHESLKTHCKRGHEFTPANTYYYQEGRARRCRACRRITEGKTQ